MQIQTVPTNCIPGQKPGTSGLRSPVSVYRQVHFLENYIQSILNCYRDKADKPLIIGGDGRYHNDNAIQTIIRMAIANGFKNLVVGRHGLLSTPAAAHLILKRKACGAIILTASHNPGGPDGDFGIKFNAENGAAIPSTMNEKIYNQTLDIREYRIAETENIDLSILGARELGDGQLEVIDSVVGYADAMEEFFDFESICKLFRRPKFRFCFDAMNAVGGQYAREIFERRLGAREGVVMNAEPKPDFGGKAPDPSPTNSKDLVSLMNSDDPPDFGAAIDGDGDRAMFLATGLAINACDSLAIMLANSHSVPGFKNKVVGVARSMPTSRAVDRVAKSMEIPCYETPAGWKNFGNLFDKGLISLCGEESYGAGSFLVPEKDGIWATLFWLDMIARKSQPPIAILRSHWERFGRVYFTRHDYDHIEKELGDELLTNLKNNIKSIKAKTFMGLEVTDADNYSYTDPVDGSQLTNQGIRVLFKNGGRMVARFSGTSTRLATLRVYYDYYEHDPTLLSLDPQKALRDLIDSGREILCMKKFNIDKPTSYI